MSVDRLESECRLFCRYLTGELAAEYVIEKYVQAHEPISCGPGEASSRFEEALLALARSGVWGLRLADAYSAVFARSGLLRRKLVLLIAILESFGPTVQRVDSPDGTSVPALMAEVSLATVLFLAFLAAGIVVLTPLRLAYSLAARRRAEDGTS